MAYRALEFSGNALTDFLNKYGKKGTIVSFPEFLSCGSTKEAAFFNKAEKNVRIVMEVKSAPDISLYADGIRFRGYDPSELLLNMGKQFQVTGQDFKDGIYEIRMIQIN